MRQLKAGGKGIRGTVGAPDCQPSAAQVSLPIHSDQCQHPGLWPDMVSRTGRFLAIDPPLSPCRSIEALGRITATGLVTRPSTASDITCAACDGVGRVRVPLDAHARRLLFEILGLIGGGEAGRKRPERVTDIAAAAQAPPNYKTRWMHFSRDTECHGQVPRTSDVGRTSARGPSFPSCALRCRRWKIGFEFPMLFCR